MKNKKTKICFVTIEGPPDFLGGYSLYHKNLIEYIKENKINWDITWVYFGKENKSYNKEGVLYFELKSIGKNYFTQIKRHFLLAKFFRRNYFDIINSIGGIWTFLYKKRKNQKIIQTFHGTAYYFNKNQMRRFNLLKRILISPILQLSWLLERPHKATDKIICVSEKVKHQVIKLYGRRKIFVVRTGVSLNNFKPRDKNKSKKEINLDIKKDYGLYIGGGGYWGKGLDRAIKLSKEIYKINKNYKLIIAGADYTKVKHLLNEKFIIYLDKVERKNIPYYYNASEVFFCMSRYEGGAPTLVVSEAMASGCLLVCSKDSEQEIIENNKNGLIIESFNEKYAKILISILDNKRKKNEIIKNSIKTIKELSLEKWGKKTISIIK